MSTPFLLHDKHYLITGAASGIGRATSIFASAMGAKLLLADIDETGLEETRKSCRGNVNCLLLDLSDLNNIQNRVYDAVGFYGKLNGMVHVAGVPCIAPLKALTLEKLEKVLAINTLAAVELSKAFCNRKALSPAEEHSIVFISSVYASLGSPCSSGYAISKAGIEGLTRALAMEMASRRIRVNCIAPGFIKTPMDETVSKYFDSEHDALVQSMHPLGLGEPEDIAYAVVYLLSKAAKWVTGSIMHVDGGFSAQ